jgi:hypothetical protein
LRIKVCDEMMWAASMHTFSRLQGTSTMHFDVDKMKLNNLSKKWDNTRCLQLEGYHDELFGFWGESRCWYVARVA